MKTIIEISSNHNFLQENPYYYINIHQKYIVSFQTSYTGKNIASLDCSATINGCKF